MRRVKAHHGDALKGIAQIGENLAASAGGATGQNCGLETGSGDHSAENVAASSDVRIHRCLTVFLGFNSTFAVDSIDGLTKRTVLTQNLIGLVFLPLLG